MGKADLHIHTSYSYDSSCSVPAMLEWAANYTELDAVAITDHDAMGGALKALELGPKYGVQVIPGCEITTRDGHLLAFYITKLVPRGLSMLETVLRVGELGGLCVAAHPCGVLVGGANEATLRQIHRHPDASQVMVGLETCNTGVFYQGSNKRAQLINTQLGLSATGGSDSHVFWTIGASYTSYDGRSPEDLRKALLAHSTAACRNTGRRPASYWPRHVTSYMLRKLGWVTWTEEPESFVLRRLNDVQAG